MSTITIPHNVTKGEELVVMSKREYERLVSADPKTQHLLDPDIAEALEDVKAGRMSGPFSTAKELITHLHAQKQ